MLRFSRCAGPSTRTGRAPVNHGEEANDHDNQELCTHLRWLPLSFVALAAPVAGQQPYTVMAGPGSHEAVKNSSVDQLPGCVP